MPKNAMESLYHGYIHPYLILGLSILRPLISRENLNTLSNGQGSCVERIRNNASIVKLKKI